MTMPFPLRHPDPDPNAGGDPPKPEAKPAPVDLLAQSISVGGDEKMTVAELLAERGRNTGLTEKVTKAEKLAADVQTMMFAANPPQEEYEAAVRRVMGAQGASAAEIDAWLAAGQEPAEGEPGGEGANAPDLDDMSARLKKAEERADASDVREKRFQKREQARLNNLLVEKITGQLDSNKALGILFSRLNAFNGEGHSTKLRPRYTERMRDAALKTLEERVRVEGLDNFADGWIVDAAAKAADALAAEDSSVIGAVDSLGRVPETAGGSEPPKELEPLPMPKPGSPATIADDVENVGNWLKRELNVMGQKAMREATQA